MAVGSASISAIMSVVSVQAHVHIIPVEEWRGMYSSCLPTGAVPLLVFVGHAEII